MSYFENLRRQIQEEASRKGVSAASYQEEQSKKEASHRIAVEIGSNNRRQKENARSIFRESKLPEVISAFRGAIPDYRHNDCYSCYRPRDMFGSDPNSVVEVITWNSKVIPGSYYDYRLASDHSLSRAQGLVIEATPNGVIEIKGGCFGSSSLAEREWRGNPGRLVEAFEKAYRSPKTIILTHEIPSPPRRPDPKFSE